MTEYDLIWMSEECQRRRGGVGAGVYAIEMSSLRLMCIKYESYILHSSAVMYTFQNLNTAVNDKVSPDL